MTHIYTLNEWVRFSWQRTIGCGVNAMQIINVEIKPFGRIAPPVDWCVAFLDQQFCYINIFQSLIHWHLLFTCWRNAGLQWHNIFQIIPFIFDVSNSCAVYVLLVVNFDQICQNCKIDWLKFVSNATFYSMRLHCGIHQWQLWDRLRWFMWLAIWNTWTKIGT